MTKSLMITLAMIAVSAVAMAPAQAGKKPGIAADQGLPSTQIADLTAQECTNLGGTVKSDSHCRGSGKACKMESANGDFHSVCLEAKTK